MLNSKEIIEARMVTELEIKSWIEEGLEDSEAFVTGDGHHFEAIVIADAFASKNTLERHRLVYTILADAMRQQIHALSLRTFTKQEFKNSQEG